MDPSKLRRTVLAAVAVASLLAVPVAEVAAGSLTIASGPIERLSGTYVGVATPGGWWSFERIAATTLPSGLGAANASATSPSSIPGNVTSQSFAVGNASAGVAGVFWQFGLTVAGAPATELEVTFGADALGPAGLTVYVLTPSTGPPGGIAVRFYLAVPGVPPTGGSIAGFTVTTQVCGGVGSCP